jgi:hypothetical protein
MFEQIYKYIRHMQEKEQIFSPIKQRILHYVEFLGISKREFYSNTGISRGTLENTAGITEDTLVKIFASCVNLNPVWVIIGTGEMILNNEYINKEYSISDAKEGIPLYKTSEFEILLNKYSEQQQLIGRLNYEIESLKKK